MTRPLARAGARAARRAPLARRAARAALLALLLPACLLAARPRPAAAVDLHVGYVDSGRIFPEYKDAQEAQQRFDRQVQGWRDEASEKEEAVKKLRAETRDRSPILSAVKRQEQEEQLQRAVGDYERFVQDVWGPHGKAAQENERATNAVVVKIRDVVEKVAADRGLTLVLDAASGFIIYADKSMDLTAQVIQQLNSTTTAPTTPAK